jgi:hypothetical protein
VTSEVTCYYTPKGLGALLPHLPQLIIASEALCGNHTAWNEVSEEEIVGVDGKLVLHRWRVSELAVVG